jgi:hypothetical protein
MHERLGFEGLRFEVFNKGFKVFNKGFKGLRFSINEVLATLDALA